MHNIFSNLNVSLEVSLKTLKVLVNLRKPMNKTVCLKCNEPSYSLQRQDNVENEDGFHIENQDRV